ncbi:MAG: hypothetical protein ACE5NC_05745, partial [Anaerolineae bacterium]
CKILTAVINCNRGNARVSMRRAEKGRAKPQGPSDRRLAVTVQFPASLLARIRKLEARLLAEYGVNRRTNQVIEALIQEGLEHADAVLRTLAKWGR